MSESEVAGIGGGAAGGYPALMAHAYQSASDAEAGDFKAIYASDITLALSELPFVPYFESFISVVEYDGDRVVASYDLTRLDLDWDWTPGVDTATGVLTVDTATFDSGSTFVVTMRGPDPEVIDVMTDFGGPYTHQSQRDFDAKWKASATLDVGTVEAMKMVPDKDDFRAVAEIAAGGKLRRVYTRISHGFTWAPAGGGDEGVLTVVGADMLTGSTFIVFVAGPEHGTKVLSDAGDATALGKITQHQDRAGKIQPAGADAASAITMIQLGQLMAITGPGIARSGIHFTAVQNAATEIDLAGGVPSITDIGQFLGVAQISTAGVVTIFYPHVNVFDWDAANNQLTVTGATFDPTDIFVVVIAGADRFASLPDNHGLMARTNSDRLGSDDSGVELLGTPLALTTSYQDIGARISCFGYTMLELGLTIDINLSTGLEFQALACFSQAGVEEYSPVIETPYSTVVKVNPAYWEDDTNADKLIAVPFRLSGAVPFVQIQARVQAVGGTAAEIDYAETVRGWG